jgi:hypothetical protein
VDDRPNQEPDDLLPLLIGQAGVQAAAQLVEQVQGHLGHGEALRGLQSRPAAFQLGLLGRDPVELDVKLLVRETTADVEGEGLTALIVQRLERPGQGDRLGDRDRPLGAPFSLSVKIVEDVAGIPQPALDVGPDQRLDRIGPDRLAPAPADDRSALDELPGAAIPADLAPPLRAAVRQAADPAADRAPQEVDATGVLRDRPVGRQSGLGGVP